MKIQKEISNTVDVMLHATVEYNKLVHSVTNKRPVDVLHASTAKLRQEIKNRDRKRRLYISTKVEADSGTSVLINGRMVHKDNLR